MNSLFGEYNDCNPILDGPQAGVFACESGDDGMHWSVLMQNEEILHQKMKILRLKNADLCDSTCPGHTAVDWLVENPSTKTRLPSELSSENAEMM